MMHGYGYDNWVAWLFMGLVWLLLLALVIILALRLLPPGSRPGRGGSGESPLDVLDHRFARGELELDTYRAQRAVLEESQRRDHRR
jgi:putative membrane protein